MRRFMGEEKRRKGGRTKDSLDFFGLGLLDERVEDDDMLGLISYLVYCYYTE